MWLSRILGKAWIERETESVLTLGLNSFSFGCTCLTCFVVVVCLFLRHFNVVNATALQW